MAVAYDIENEHRVKLERQFWEHDATGASASNPRTYPSVGYPFSRKKPHSPRWRFGSFIFFCDPNDANGPPYEFDWIIGPTPAGQLDCGDALRTKCSSDAGPTPKYKLCPRVGRNSWSVATGRPR